MKPSYEGVRFDPQHPTPHVESYFLKANDPKRARALWIKTTIYAPARDPHATIAEGWAVAFREDGTSVAVKQQWPFLQYNCSVISSFIR